jgi:hypothetical protein
VVKDEEEDGELSTLEFEIVLDTELGDDDADEVIPAILDVDMVVPMSK